MYTLRIEVPNTAPLDGVTPIDLTTTRIRSQTGEGKGPLHNERATNILLAQLDGAATFGIYDHGEVFNRRNLNVRLIALTVLPQNDGTLARGDRLELVGPSGQREKLFDLARNNGINNSLDLVIPVGHKLAFDTQAGGAMGPYRIDMTFLDITNPAHYFGRRGDS